MNCSNYVKIKYLGIVIFAFISKLCVSIYAENEMTLDDVLKQIDINEKKIHNVQASLKAVLVEKDNFPEYELDWGYEDGKEYIRGTERFLPNELYELDTVSADKIIVAETVSLQTTFDGEKQYFFRHSSHEKLYKSRGAISPLDPRVFRYKLTPNVLMGYDAHEFGRTSLVDGIKQAESCTLSKEKELVNGISCYVLEITSIEIDPGTEVPWDVKVWIDPSRDFRPLKIEKYFGGVEGNNKFKVLRWRVEDIELEKIDNIWFPVKGEMSYFTISEVSPPAGISKEEFDTMTPEERRNVAIYKLKKMPLTRIVTIEPNTVRINQEMPEKIFKIDFPTGCAIYDEFAQVGYVVGGQQEFSALHSNDFIEKNVSIADNKMDICTEVTNNEMSKHDISEKYNEPQKTADIDTEAKVSQNHFSLIHLVSISVVLLVIISTLYIYLKKR